jgi:thiamine-monophosphate kinase
MGDDAALFVAKKGYRTILTCDWFLEGIHFLQDKHPPDAVGWKCLARAVSDVAAMGGEPRCFLLSLALPSYWTGRWLDRFLLGLRRAAQYSGCVLAGGDTTRAAQILINVTVVGEVRAGMEVRRAGARPGDIVFVSGRLGEAQLGLEMIRRSKVRVTKPLGLLKKHLYPEPRVRLGRWLAERGLATAMMDLSDGLSTDLPRLCAASCVGARIESERIPKVQLAGKVGNGDVDPLLLALNGGDDYELLFTASRNNAKRLPRALQGIPLTAIGEITKGQSLMLCDKDGRERLLANRGWDPFRSAGN